LDCGGKRSATPLWKLDQQSKSGVAAALSNFALQLPLAPLLSSASEFQKDSMPTLNWIGKEAVVNR
jgi:hypothetical protein